MLAVLDACAALQYKEDYSRALEKRAVARKALGEFTLAVEDCKCSLSLSSRARLTLFPRVVTNAAECSTEQNYRRRMLAEAEKAGQAEAERRKLIGTTEPLERDFGQAHLEFLSRGNDLSKNPIVQTIVMVFNEIEEGWKRFFETCDPESDHPDIEGLLMVLGKLLIYTDHLSSIRSQLCLLSFRGSSYRSESYAFHLSRH